MQTENAIRPLPQSRPENICELKLLYLNCA